jgi:hypothetical protein
MYIYGCYPVFAKHFNTLLQIQEARMLVVLHSWNKYLKLKDAEVYVSFIFLDLTLPESENL